MHEIHRRGEAREIRRFLARGVAAAHDDKRLVAEHRQRAVARGAVRFSMGRTTTEADVDAVLAALPGVIERARTAGLALRGAAE